MKIVIKPLLILIGFILLTAFYYWQICSNTKSTVYGFSYGFERGIMMFIGFCFFWILIKQIPFLNYAKQKINKYPSAKHRGGDVIALILGITYIVAMYFGSVKFNRYLLDKSGKITKGIIIDCRQGKSYEYCLYQYSVNDKLYQIQLTKTPKYFEQDSVTVLYYPKWPIISTIKE
jgi:hypothetical protein